MDHDAFLRGVMERAGFQHWWSAEKAVEATVEAVGARILEADRRAVVPLLGEPFAEMLVRRPHVGASELADLFAEVTGVEGVEPGFAMEHVEAVCELLAERLHPDAVTMLRTHLPEDVAALFVRRERSVPPERAGRPAPRKSTPISVGQVGSAHPLSGAHPDRAHAESVAKSDNPHADTKVSSAPGLTQEREHEDLAEGHVGSDRDVSTTKN